MSRMRQIPVMEITQREKMIQQSQPTGMEYVTKARYFLQQQQEQIPRTV